MQTETPRMTFWRELNKRLADHAQPEANFGEMRAAYEVAMIAAVRDVAVVRKDNKTGNEYIEDC